MLRIGVLGPVSAWLDDRPVTLGPAKQRAVLAALAFDNNRVVPVGQLVESVWGVDSSRGSRQLVAGYVSRLRQVLARAGADGFELVWHHGGYRLDIDADRVDLHRFRRLVAQAQRDADNGRSRTAADLLQEALSLWRGEPLSDVRPDGWLDHLCGALEQERWAALELRIALDLRLGRHERIWPELYALLAENPLRERLAVYLMVALQRSDRQADALLAFTQVRERLADELGVAPGAELRGLHEALTRHARVAGPVAG
jgi:DNA-binding SARP family transcriptional activator